MKILNLSNYKYIAIFILFFAGIYSAIGQASTVQQNGEQFQIIKENPEEKDKIVENDKLIENENNLFNKTHIFSNKNFTNNKELQPKKIRTTKIGELFSRIGLGLKKYCQDNKISGKKALRILKMIN